MQKKTRICQVSSVHKTFDTRIFKKICVSLTEKYDVYYVSANAKNEVVNGVNIIGVELPQSRYKRFFKLDRVYKQLCLIDADVYHFHDPELLSIGAKIHRRLGKKVIFDSHEDGPMQFLTKEYLPQWFAYMVCKIYTVYEKYYLKKYDAVVSVTPSIIERLKKINPNTYQITNYPKYKDVDIQGNTYENKVCFFGGILPQWMHDKIIMALKGINVKYILAGPVYPPNLLEKLLTEENREQIEYKGIIKQEECLHYMRQCSAGLAIIDYVANFGGKLGTLGNNKLFEYMLQGIPVVATDCVLWKEIIDKYKCGICVNPHCINEIRDAILYYVNNPAIAREHGRNGQEAVKAVFNWETQERVLFNMYNNLLRT